MDIAIEYSFGRFDEVDTLVIERLIDEFQMTHQAAADAVGRSRSAASNLLRLLKLPQDVQEMLMENLLDMGHARALLPLEAAQQILLANKIVMEKLSVRETEKMVQRQIESPAQQVSNTKPKTDRDTLRIQEEISAQLGTRVEIKSGKSGSGKLVIEYSSNDELSDLLSRLSKDK